MSPSPNLDQKPDTSSPPDSLKQDDMHTSTNSTSSLVRGRPKTTYFHGGIGGAGNYRKHRQSPITRGLSTLFGGNPGGAASGGNAHPGQDKPTIPTEDDLARANVRQKVSPSRGFLGIGGLGNRRSQRQRSPASDATTSADSGYDSNYNAPTTHIGAAEIMRRKMLGEKARQSNSR
ncbi:MAG: hypothetical protein Q9201_005271 [Fulgogasparrea decipioides]